MNGTSLRCKIVVRLGEVEFQAWRLKAFCVLFVFVR